MLQQILIRTPFYVWIILAALIYRGYVSSKDREVAFWKLLIIPAVMPLLTVPALALKFGPGGRAIAIWAAAAGIATLLTWQLSRGKVSAAEQSGNVLVRGSWLPLVAMMAVFFSKYAFNVLLAINPLAHHDTLFAVVFCSLFGVFNGIFFGWTVRDTTTYLKTRAQSPMISMIS